MGSMARGAVTMLVGGMRKGRDMVEKGQGVVGVVALPDSRDDVHHDGRSWLLADLRGTEY